MSENAERGLVLNLGCGKTHIEGAMNLDLKDGWDARALPFAKGSVRQIYCSHMLEHFDRVEAGNVLQHWADLLEPGGELLVAVPDAKRLMSEIDESNWSRHISFIVGGCKDQHDVHKMQFTLQVLASMLRMAGFGDIRPFDSFMEDCSSYDFSLNLRAVKRDMSLPENPRVIAVMPEPRLTFSAYHACWRDLLRQCQVGEARVGGAYWEKTLEHGVVSALESGADLLLFGDYDTLFSPDDYRQLLEDITTNPDIDAVTGVQMSRHNDKPLVLENHLDHEKPLTRVRFAHFGFTLVKAKVFHELPRPWFMSVPGVDGWDTQGQCDADITFWRMMDSWGFKTWWDNRVLLGHMDLCAIWPHERGVMFQPMRDYTKRGRPAQAKFVPEVFQNVARAEGVDPQTEDEPEQVIAPREPGVRELVQDLRELNGKHEPEAASR